MSTRADISLRLSRIIQADRETVFRAWTEPEHLKRWSCPKGFQVEDVRVDLRIGGEYRIRMKGADDQAHTAAGVYRKIDRAKRLVYTWDWLEEDHRMGETLVTVEFNEMEGSTEVVVIHERFPNSEARDDHENGWTSCLNRLEQLHA